MAGYYRNAGREWVQPIRYGYKIACCSCGLTHRFNFRLIKNRRGPGKVIQYQAERDERATGQIRRWMKQSNPAKGSK